MLILTSFIRICFDGRHALALWSQFMFVYNTRLSIQDTFQRTFKLSLFVILSLLGACSKDHNHPLQQHLKLNFFAEPAHLDPRQANYSISSNIYPMLYDGLMRFDPSGRLVPSVAKSVSSSMDGRFYIFHLKQTTWSNGDPVTAYDFEYAWKWILDPNHPAPMASHLYCLKNGKLAKDGAVPLSWVGVYAKDSETLVVELEYPLPYFLELTSVPNFFPVNHLRQNEVEKFGCLGNGPFVVKEWKPQREISLERNPKYWDVHNVPLEEIHISFIQDPNTEMQLYKKKQLDWAGAPISQGLPYNALSNLHQSGLLDNHPFLGTYYYSFNTQRPPFNNQKIRKAFSAAIRRKDLVEHITQGGESPAYRFVPSSINFQDNDNVEPSPEEVQKLFEEGLKELRMTRSDLPNITLSYNKSDMHHALAQAVQHDWKEILGVDVQLKNRDWKAHLSEIKAGNFDIARLAWKGISSDPIHFLEIFQDPGHPMHNTQWKNSRFIKLVHTAMKSGQLDERLFYLAQAEKILTDEMPIAPVFYLNICYIKNPGLKGYVINQLGAIDFKWAAFEEEHGKISH